MNLREDQLKNVQEIIKQNNYAIESIRVEMNNMKEKMDQMQNALKMLEENNNAMKNLFGGGGGEMSLRHSIEDLNMQRLEEDEDTSEETETYFKDNTERILKKKPAALFILTFGAIRHLKTYQDEHAIGYKSMAIKGNSCITCKNKIRIWDLTTGNTTMVLKDYDEKYCSLYAFQNWIIVGTRSKNMKVWDFATGELLKTFKVDSEIKSISGYDNFIYAGSKKGIVYIWDFLKDKKMTLEAHQNKIYYIATDSKHIYTASKDCTIRIWSRHSGKFVCQLKHNSAVNYVAFHPERNYLISGTYDGVIRVWSMKDYKVLAELKGHQGAIVAINVYKDFILSAGRDGTLKFWNCKFNLVASVKCHDENFSNFLVSDKKLITSSKNKAIKVWCVEDEEMEN